MDAKENQTQFDKNTMSTNEESAIVEASTTSDENKKRCKDIGRVLSLVGDQFEITFLTRFFN